MMKRLMAMLEDANSTHQEDGVDPISTQLSNETSSQKPIQDIILPRRHLPVVPVPKRKGFYPPEQSGSLDNTTESSSARSTFQKRSSSSTLPTPMRHQVDNLEASLDSRSLLKNTTQFLRPTTPAPQKQRDKPLLSESGASSQPNLPYLNLDRFSILGKIGEEPGEQKRKRPGSAASSKRKTVVLLLPPGPILPPKLSRIEEAKLLSFRLDSSVEDEKPKGDASFP